MLSRWALTLGFVLSLTLSAVPACAGQVRLSAASSLTEAMSAICSRYGGSHPEVTLVRNFASSGTLANQIDSGAPADLFVSANPRWMAYLVERGRIPRAGVRILATNTLVVVGPKQGQVGALADLTKMARVAIGSPKSVPAGEYAETALMVAGIYDQLRQENRLVIAKDVRQALMYAERGEVDAAFVYRTDALLARQAAVLYEVPGALYPPATYLVGLTVEGANNREAQEFFAYLKTSETAIILQQYGFGAEGQPASP